jgi:hypothetical protein
VGVSEGFWGEGRRGRRGVGGIGGLRVLTYFVGFDCGIGMVGEESGCFLNRLGVGFCVRGEVFKAVEDGLFGFLFADVFDVLLEAEFEFETVLGWAVKSAYLRPR